MHVMSSRTSQKTNTIEDAAGKTTIPQEIESILMYRDLKQRSVSRPAKCVERLLKEPHLPNARGVHTL